ncbi:unnamed protein product [Gordionus sp. m RMFG-2023]
MSGMWELYRKEAMQWEYEIDSKLISLSKLSIKGNDSFQQVKDIVTQDSSAIDSNLQTNSIDLITNDIQRLLIHLEEINEKMGNHVQNHQATPTQSNFPPTYFHTLQRHREIYQDYKNEFETLKNNLKHTKQREDLIGSTTNLIKKQQIPEYYKYSPINRRTDLHLKEQEHLKNSEKLIDHHIDMAFFTKENLKLQKRNLLKISKKVNFIIEKFPIINRLSQKISLKKRKETIILSFVISTCFVFLLYYMIH